MRRRLRDSAARDDGATIVVVAITLVVLLGMGALVIDVGNLYWERRQLQTGASAASLAVAQDIARTIVDPAGSPPSAGPLGGTFFDTADDYADRNAADGASDVDALTLDTVGGQPLTDAGEVTVTTLVDGGQLSHVLAPVLGIDSSPVEATASAIYGALVAGKGFPFAVCEQLWQDHGTGPPPFDIVYKSSPNPPPNDCDVDGSFPGTNPGNFGWLEPEGGECEARYSFESGADTGQSPGDPGSDIPNECTQPGPGTGEVEQIAQQIASATTPQDLPVRVLPRYTEVVGNGTNATYTLSGFAAFRFFGVKMKGGQNEVFATWSNPDCTGGGSNKLCVRGHFVKAVATGSVDPDANSDVIGVELNT